MIIGRKILLSLALVTLVTASCSDGTHDDLTAPADPPRVQKMYGEAVFCCVRYLSQDEYIKIENYLFKNVNWDIQQCADLASTAWSLLWAGNMRAGQPPEYGASSGKWGLYAFNTQTIVIAEDHFSGSGRFASETLVHEAYHHLYGRDEDTAEYFGIFCATDG